MNELAEAIAKAKNLEDLVPVLESLVIRVNRLAAKGKVTACDMQNIAGYLANIRMMLRTLEQFEGSPRAVSDLAKRYLDLEGRVKEIRNDLDMALKRMAA